MPWRTTGSHRMGGWVSATAGLDDLKKKISQTCKKSKPIPTLAKSVFFTELSAVSIMRLTFMQFTPASYFCLTHKNILPHQESSLNKSPISSSHIHIDYKGCFTVRRSTKHIWDTNNVRSEVPTATCLIIQVFRNVTLLFWRIQWDVTNCSPNNTVSHSNHQTQS